MSIKEKLAKAAFKTKKFLKNNGPTICTVVGCVGVVATGVLAWHGRAKCDEILTEEDEDLGVFGKIVKTVPAWAPVVGVGVLSMGAIILSNGLSKKQIAALATCNAMNAGALMRTKESIDERTKEIKEYVKSQQKDLNELPDNERREMIFENDCDNFVVCLDPDGELYWDDWADIWFRQKSEIVESAYFTLNREYARDNVVSLHRLYELWGFENSDWARVGIKPDFKDIGWEKYEAFDPRLDDKSVATGIDFIDFRETNDKMTRIFGAANTVSDWPKKGAYTRITYQYVPNVLFRPDMSDDDLDEYFWNMSFIGNARFDSEFA